MGAVVSTLGEKPGVLANTYIVFTSDNGWHHGEHRIRSGKARPYEESVRVPLVIRGPGVAAESTTDNLVLNTDYFPTFMDLAEGTNAALRRWAFFASCPHGARPVLLEDGHPD